ncbi:MAG: hypothetical protein KDA75_21970, partial [Planctomycetaceae bacterium]|nr:hypothetical protein [Planctomycetaceae bacterium]
MVAKSLVEMRKAAEYADGSRERALAARLMAETFVLNGEPAKARAEFAGLSNASKYAGIAPLVIEAWRQLAAGDEAKAKAAIEEAFALKELLPKRGSEALDMSANLAASLAAIGRTDDAQALVQNREDPDAGEFTTLWRAAVDGGDYRFDQVVRRTSLQEQAHPQWAAVAQTLTAHERLTEAREWVLAAPDLVIRDNTAGVAAAQAARQLGAGDALNRQIEPLVAALEPAGQARVWSGVGQGLLERDDQAGARDAATKAAAALESISIGAPAVVPEMKELYELADQPNRGLPDPLPARTAALAAFDLFSLESRLGDHQAALPRVQLALQFLQSAAPSAKATGAIVAELDKSPTAVRNRFKETFQLNDAVIVSRFSKYQTQVRAWHEQALDRRDREVRLLSDVALAGASAEVWKAIRAAEESEDPGTSQVYFDTQLPSLLVDLADRQQAAGLRQEITDVLKAREISVSSSSTDQLRAFFSQPVDLNDLKSLIGRLTPYYQRPPQDRALVD